MHDLARIFKSDWCNGIVSRKGRFILPFVVSFFLCVTFVRQFHSYSSFHNADVQLSFIECLMYFFRGMEKFDPSDDTFLNLPITYVYLNLYLAYLIGDYLVKDIKGFGIYMLLNTGSRSKWWISKCLWNLITVCIFYTSIILGTMAGWLLTTKGKGGFWNIDRFASGYILNNNTVEVSSKTVAEFFACVLLISISFSIMQMMLSVFIKPVGSFFSIAVITVVSAYYCAWFLPGNYMMLLRINELHNINSYIMSVIIIIASFFIGLIYFRKRDLI